MKASFDKVAYIYDFFMISNRLYKEKIVADFLKPLDSKEILDIGGGTGRYSKYLTSLGAKSLLIDVSRKMTDKIKDRSRITVVNEDFLTAEIPDNFFDAVIICDVYHHIENKILLIEKIRDCLKKDGVLVIYDFDLRNIFTRCLKLFEEFIFKEKLFFENYDDTKKFLTSGFFAVDKEFFSKNVYIIRAILKNQEN